MSTRQNPTPHEHDQPWIGGNRKVMEDHVYKGHGYAPSRNPTSDPWEIHRDLHRAEGTPMPTMSSDSNQLASTVPSAEEARRQIQRLERTALDFRAERDDLKEQLSRAPHNYGSLLDELRAAQQKIEDFEEELAAAYRETDRQKTAKLEVRTARNDAERKLLEVEGERDELLRTRDAVADSLRQRHRLLIEEMRGDIQSARSEADQARHQLTVATDHNIELQRQLDEKPPLVVLSQKQVDKLLKAKAKVDPRA